MQHLVLQVAFLLVAHDRLLLLRLALLRVLKVLLLAQGTAVADLLRQADQRVPDLLVHLLAVVRLDLVVMVSLIAAETCRAVMARRKSP